MELNLNNVINQDCLEYMKTLPDESIDLIVTSPPYAEQRAQTYGGIPAQDYPEWMRQIGLEIHRVLKNTGSFVLNIKEHAHKGARDTYVLKTVLILSEIFIWNDTFIWNKPNAFPTGNKRRLKDGFEYCYLFVKSNKYKFFPENVLVPSVNPKLDQEKNRTNKGFHGTNNKSGMTMSTRIISDMVRPSNVLTLVVGAIHNKHPAAFPIGLPTFFIKLLTEENDVVYDPFAGSGTTLIAAKKLQRNFIGTELMPEYVELTKQNLDATEGEKT